MVRPDERFHRAGMSTTIQTIDSDRCDGEKVIDERTATTPAGARRSLRASIDRAHRANPHLDGVGVQHAENLAAAWDGVGDIKLTIRTWNAMAGVTIWAQTR